MIPSRKPLRWENIVPVVGLLYVASFATGLILRSLISSGSLATYQLFFIPLATFSAIIAATVLWRPRAGYIAAVVISVALIAIFFLTKDGNDVITVLSNPGRNYVQFAFYVTSVPQFFSTLLSSLFGLWKSR